MTKGQASQMSGWGQLGRCRRSLHLRSLVLPITVWLFISAEVQGSEGALDREFLPPSESEIRECINTGGNCLQVGTLSQSTELIEEIDAEVYKSRKEMSDADSNSIPPTMIRFDLAVPMQVTVTGQGYAYFSLFGSQGESITPNFPRIKGGSLHLDAGRYVLLGYPDFNALRGSNGSLVTVIDPAKPQENGATPADETSKTSDRSQNRRKQTRQIRLGAILGILLTIVILVTRTH